MESKSGKSDEERAESLGASRRADSLAAYELIDFGDGRKLERFGGKVLDRPSPAAVGWKRRRPDVWIGADSSYRSQGASGWSVQEVADNWMFRWESIALELRLSPFGHVGVFPEQIGNWKWLRGFAAEKLGVRRALNLFGYTGGSTLVLAQAGYEVTHVDASHPTVRWARTNAAHSGLDKAPIRWIVDDVRHYVSKAMRKGESYDVIVMDPPAYGHGAQGQSWELDRDLDLLIEGAIALLSPQPMAFLLTGHSPIRSLAKGPISGRSWDRLKAKYRHLSKHRVSLADAEQRKLDFGYAYRFWNDEADHHGPRTG